MFVVAMAQHGHVHIEDGMPSLHLGPRMGQFFQECLEDNKGPFIFSFVLGTLAVTVTLCLVVKQILRLRAAPICVLRECYGRMMIMPGAWAVSAILTLVCPRSAVLSELIRGQSEAFALYQFMNIIFMILSLASTPENNSEEAIGWGVIRAINDEGPKPHMAVPPLFCCCVSCFPSHLMSAKLLLRAACLVRQYVILMFLISIFGLWVIMAAPAETALKMKSWSAVVLKASAMTAVYGLFVLYKSTHDLLHDWSTTKKFISIKFVIGLSVIQGKLVSWLIHRFRHPERTCLLDPKEPESLEWVIDHWIAMLIAVESVIMVLLTSSAFPVEEVQSAKAQPCAFVEMSLERVRDVEETYADVASSDSADE